MPKSKKIEHKEEFRVWPFMSFISQSIILLVFLSSVEPTTSNGFGLCFKHKTFFFLNAINALFIFWFLATFRVPGHFVKMTTQKIMLNEGRGIKLAFLRG
jgi:hypothetical protein